MTRRGGKSEINWSASANGFDRSRPSAASPLACAGAALTGPAGSSPSVSGKYPFSHAPNPNWRMDPAGVRGDLAAEICTSEVEGQWHRFRDWLDATGKPFPYGEVA